MSDKTPRAEAVRTFRPIRKGGSGRFGHSCMRARRNVELVLSSADVLATSPLTARDRVKGLDHYLRQ